MTTIVVPHRGPGGKTRLNAGADVVTAMLEDVLAACTAVGRTILVTPVMAAARADIEVVHDRAAGQGEAVAAALERVSGGPVLVVNSDVPCVTPDDLRLLLDAIPPGGLALVEAEDGTTNALALSEPGLFRPLYGPGSAARFRELAPSRTVRIPNLEHDVDEREDWPDRPRLGSRTRALAARP